MFITIVIPTYNRADRIRKTVDSLILQSCANFEIIVVDDGSTDNTEGVIGAIDDKRLRYLKKSNAERGAARNTGARLAIGEYINFFDSDDIAYPHHVREAERVLTKLNYPEVVHLAYDIKDEGGNLLRVANEFPAKVNKLLITGNHLSCNGVFIRKDVALKYRFNEDRTLSASEDYELWLRLASRYEFHADNVVTSTIVNHEARSVLRIDAGKLVRRISSLINHVEQNSDVTKYFGQKMSKFKSHLNLYIALHLAMADCPSRQSLSYLFKAIQQFPLVVFTRKFLAIIKNMVS